MASQFDRTSLLIGEDGVEKLKNSKVIIFGLGGVGSYVTEALARAGVGNFILCDHDTVDITNLNRQIYALNSTVGKYKADIAKDRILDINPNANIEVRKEFFMPDSEDFFTSDVSYIVDAIDTVTAKIEVICRAYNKNIPVISSMGTGNKLNPTMFKVEDIYKTKIDPLAKVMRKELKARNIDKLKVVYSEEEPIKFERTEENKKPTPGSISFVPSVAGLTIASEVIKDILRG